MAKMTGGEALVASLYREGVRVVFGLPGVQLYGVMAALRDEPRIRFITTRHEQATSYMADVSSLAIRNRCIFVARRRHFQRRQGRAARIIASHDIVRMPAFHADD